MLRDIKQEYNELTKSLTTYRQRVTLKKQEIVSLN